MLGGDRAELVLVEVVSLRVLVVGAEDEGDLVEGEVERTEDSADESLVVVGAVSDELDGSLEVVEEGVDVCRKVQ